MSSIYFTKKKKNNNNRKSFRKLVESFVSDFYRLATSVSMGLDAAKLQKIM